MAMRLDGWKWVRRAVLLCTAVSSGCQAPEAVPEPAPPNTSAGQTPAPELPATSSPTPSVEPAPVPPPVTAPGPDARRPWWRASYPGGVYPQSLAVGDFDGDGAPDVVVGAQGGNYQGKFVSSRGTLRVLRNDGHGALSSTSSLHALLGASGHLAVGDTNGDGRLDVLTGTRVNAQVWLGKGTGELLEPGREQGLGAEPTVNLGVGKGGDGEPLLWHLGIGLGAWGGPVTGPRFVFARPRADTSFEQWEPLPDDILLRDGRAYDTPGLSAAVADFNEDGLLDAVFSNDQFVAGSTEVSRVFLGDATGRLVAGDALYPLRPFLRVSPADFNRDGHVDLLVLYPDARSVSVLLGTGRGTFSSVSMLTLPEPASEVAVVEWSGDGVPDVVAVHETLDAVSLLRGRGDGGFAWHGGIAVGRAPRAVATADLDRDGRPELLVAESGENTVSVYTPPDAPQAGPLLPAGCPWPSKSEEPAARPPAVGVMFPSLPGGTEAVVAGDFDSDGQMDLALAQYHGGVQVLSHAKNGQHALRVLEGLRGRYVTRLTAGDFDGDGRTDLAALYQPNGRDKPPYVPVIFWNDPLSSFASSLEFERWNEQVGLLAGDFNRDGLTDLALAFAGHASGNATRLTSLGQRRFRAETLPGLNPTGDAANPSLTLPMLLAGESRRDGTQVLLHTTSTGLTLHATTREGQPLPAQGYATTPYRDFSFFADVDGDGFLDVLSSSRPSNSPSQMSLMRGDGQGSLNAPLECTPPRPGYITAWRDLDGDGIEDVLLVSGSTVWVMLRTAGGGWRALIPHELGGAYNYSIVWTGVADLTGDARPELLVYSQSGALWMFPPPEA